MWPGICSRSPGRRCGLITGAELGWFVSMLPMERYMSAWRSSCSGGAVTDPTIDSQIISLQSGGDDALILGMTVKFDTMSFRRTAEMCVKATLYIATGAATVASTIIPAGADRLGTITSVYTPDPS